MANSYTAIPNIVPGNLTVTGNLNVSGGQIAVGKFQRQYRIQEIGNGLFVETVNVDRIAGAQDDVTTKSLMRVIYVTGPPFAVATEAAGSPMVDTYLLNQQPNSLQVSSQELRLGTVVPYSRFLDTGLAAIVTTNLQGDLLTRDTPAYAGYGLALDSQQQSPYYQVVNPAGAAYIAAAPICIWSDYLVHTTTGVTGNTLVTSKILRARAMNGLSGLLVTIAGKANIGAGGTVVLTLNFGSLSIGFYGFPAATNGPFRCTAIITNQNNTAIENVSALTTYNQLSYHSSIGVGNVDTTQDVNLQIFHSTTNAPDSSTIWCIEGHILNTYGPT